MKPVIPYILLACQIHHHSGVAYGRREKPVATASRLRWPQHGDFHPQNNVIYKDFTFSLW